MHLLLSDEKQRRYDRLYMDIALRCAEMSYATRAKVGSVIVKDGRILSMGWNGMPAGLPNECEHKDHGEWKTRPEVLHAEQNALMKLAAATDSSVGSTMYVTMAPCMMCAKLIVQAKIARVVYQETYRDLSGVDLMRRLGIYVEQISESS